MNGAGSMRPMPDARACEHRLSGGLRASASTVCTLLVSAILLSAILLSAILLSAMTASAVRAGGAKHSIVEKDNLAPSQALGRDIPFSIYLPAAARSSGGSFPVLYLLHGHGDDHTAWIEKGDIAETLDRKIASGAMAPLIVVMPAAGNSWYVDDPAPGGFGPVAQAFTDDLIAAVEARYPAARCRAARAVGGLSMGGYGAIMYAFSHPDRYAAAFSLSGSLFSELPADIERRRPAYERIYAGVFGRPFDETRFLSWNVFKLLDRLAPPRALPRIWLAAGDNDFPSIHEGTIRLHQVLRQRGDRSELHIVAGEHTWELWRTGVDQALKWLSPHLASGCRSN